MSVSFGSTILYSWFSDLFARPGAYVPPMTEMYHYPLLLSGWFGLLVTALNLLPAGQLDGGHVLYALFGRKSRIIGYLIVGGLVILAVVTGFQSWFFFAC